MKYRGFALVFAASLLISACGGNNNSKESNSSNVESSTSVEVSSEAPKIDFDKLEYVNDLLWFPDVKMEVEERVYINNYIREFKDTEILIPDEKLLKMDGDYLVGLGTGDTFIVYKADGKYQKVLVNIAAKGTYKRAYNFKTADLKGKKIACFGDSVAADGTVGDEQSVYSRRFAKKFGMEYVGNYAIGGMTGTYTAFNANIMSEYGGVVYEKCDGCNIVYNHYSAGDLKGLDYMFISFGANDMYYQSPIDDEKDKDGIKSDFDTFSCAHSFKGSYRYMIDTARAANPNIQIIIFNLHYNQYDVEHKGYSNWRSYKFDTGLRQMDYRKAMFEIGYEKDVKVIDEWNYTSELFDFSNDRQGSVTDVYKDVVHFTVYGQKLIADYMYNF